MTQYYPLCYSIAGTDSAPIIVRVGTTSDGRGALARVMSHARDGYLVYTPSLIVEELTYDPSAELIGLEDVAERANSLEARMAQMRVPIAYLEDPDSYDTEEEDWEEYDTPDYEESCQGLPLYEDVPPPSYEVAILSPPAY